MALLSAVTNIAVDNLALAAATHLPDGIARVVSQRHEDDLQDNDATLEEWASSIESSEDQERPNEDQESIVVCTSLGTSGRPSSMPGLVGGVRSNTMSCNMENLSGTLSDVEVGMMEDEFLQTGEQILRGEPVEMFLDSMEMTALNTSV